MFAYNTSTMWIFRWPFVTKMAKVWLGTRNYSDVKFSIRPKPRALLFKKLNRPRKPKMEPGKSQLFSNCCQQYSDWQYWCVTFAQRGADEDGAFYSYKPKRRRRWKKPKNNKLGNENVWMKGYTSILILSTNCPLQRTFGGDGLSTQTYRWDKRWGIA